MIKLVIRMDKNKFELEEKLKTQDGKNRLTDVVDIEGMFKLIESIPSKKCRTNKIMVSTFR